MKRIKLTVAYDGTNYCGWQIQPNAITIEEVLTKEIKKLLKEDIKLIGASRTDSGVHALGNVAIFDTDTKIPAEKLAYALNQGLPPDIRIQGSTQVADDFHPRYCNSTKTYEYKILNSKFPNPIFRLYTYFYHYDLDIGLMREAASYLVGKHDFKSFCTVNEQVKDTIREITDIQIEKEGDLITIRVKGHGFLYNMVRIISGTLINVGNGKLAPSEIPCILEGKNRALAGPTAPASGLTLIGIEYE